MSMSFDDDLSWTEGITRAPLRFLVRFPYRSHVWLGLSGDLDVANANALSSVFDSLRAAGGRTVEIDASDVEFASCAFLGVMEHHSQLFDDDGGWVILRRTSAALRRLLHLSYGEPHPWYPAAFN